MTEISIKFDSLGKPTEKAFLIIIDGREIWLPKSETRMYEKNKKVYIPDWIALKNGLI